MAEAEVDRAKELLEGRAEIAARLAHEIRGPVSTLKGLASTALVHYEGLSDEERREFLGLIKHEAERLERTVEQVALALRLDAGSLGFDIRPRDLSEVVEEAAQAAQMDGHPLELETPGPLEVPIDGRHVEFVVRQLLDNAVKFSPPGSPVAVRLHRDDGYAVLEISDGGPGIPSDRRETVFERFADWRPVGYEDRPGAGLGLFMCRAVARAHGGDAWVSDIPDGGTMLSVRLPAEG